MMKWGHGQTNVTIHDKTNHIVLGGNQRYEPIVSLCDFHFLVKVSRGIISLHKNLLCSF